ncbi:peptidoglycan recognition protein family protein [Pararhizobium sp.]|uniref:peptidoglycan recognition protein family protein n=1 Tax=Pararhizobium sp. TaxID=1977563 RepID=UPI003D129F59
MTATLQALPAGWLPAAKMQRVICHWTAGHHKASEDDKAHYHILIEDDGDVIRGKPTIDLNAAPAKKGYAAHTLNCNTGSIGVSLCCMALATESPFNPGKAPMTKAQWDKLAVVVADLCRFYGIPVTPKTVLSHAEVQGTLGITQRGKWDFTRLAFAPEVQGREGVRRSAADCRRQAVVTCGSSWITRHRLTGRCAGASLSCR